MSTRLDRYHRAVVEHGLPRPCLAVFLAASTLGGPGDVAVHVVSGGATAPTTTRLDVDGTGLVVGTWSGGHVDALLHKVSWTHFNSPRSTGDRVTQAELAFLEALGGPVVLAGHAWVRERASGLRDSALRSMLVSDALACAELYVEDAVGQLACGDVESAVLSARMAYDSAVDALLAGEGRLGQSGKWRARRVREFDQVLLPFDEYWAVETMRDFDQGAPHRWVEAVVETTLVLSRKVVI